MKEGTQRLPREAAGEVPGQVRSASRPHAASGSRRAACAWRRSCARLSTRGGGRPRGGRAGGAARDGASRHRASRWSRCRAPSSCRWRAGGGRAVEALRRHRGPRRRHPRRHRPLRAHRREAAAGLAAVARETGVPVGFGVLTRDDRGAGPGALRAGRPTTRARRRRARPWPWSAVARRGRRPRKSALGDGQANQGARVRAADALPVGPHPRAHGPGGRASSGRCARAPTRRGRWRSAWPRRAGGTAKRSTRRSRRHRELALRRASPPSTATSCASAAYELMREPQTPPSVIIDEAVELAKRFGEADSPPFVNGVLDAIDACAGSGGRAACAAPRRGQEGEGFAAW